MPKPNNVVVAPSAQETKAAAVSGLERMFGAEPDEGIAQVEGSDTTAEEEPQEAEATEQAQTQEQPGDTAEVEIDGEIYLVPKSISDRFIQHADYTRKTQDLAEMRRALSAEREATTLNHAFAEAVAQERSQLSLVEAQLQQFNTVNWQAMDTEQLLKTRAFLEQLRDMKSTLEQTIKGKRAEFDVKVNGHMKDAVESGQRFIAQHIPKFDEAIRKDLVSYGVSEGYTTEEMTKVTDPRIVVTLWKAQQWDNLKRSQPGITNKAARAAPVVRPGATQRQASPAKTLIKQIKAAKTPGARKRAGEDYLAERFK